MSFSIVEQIAQLLAARIQNVSTTNGYNTTVNDVARPLRNSGFVGSTGTVYPGAVDGLVVIAQSETINKDATNVGGNPPKVGRKIQYAIIGYLVPSDRDIIPADQLVNTFAADLEKSITNPTDGSDWRIWSGLAWNSSILNIHAFSPQEGELIGTLIELEVQYRHFDNNPYTSA